MDGDAITVVDGGTWQTVLTKGFDRFTLPLSSVGLMAKILWSQILSIRKCVLITQMQKQIMLTTL